MPVPKIPVPELLVPVPKIPALNVSEAWVPVRLWDGVKFMPASR